MATGKDIFYSDINYNNIIKSELPDNYLYISHLDGEPVDPTYTALSGAPTYWILPSYPDEMSDSMSSNYALATALGRSAPVATYEGSGPRELQIDLKLHRDIMDDLNLGRSNSDLHLGEGYVDALARAIQSIAVPKYRTSDKIVEPPLVAVKLGEEVFIKGVVNGSVGVVYHKPILENNRYALVDLSFKITEVDPYDSSSIFSSGTFRGMVNTMKNMMR